LITAAKLGIPPEMDKYLADFFCVFATGVANSLIIGAFMLKAGFYRHGFWPQFILEIL